MGQHPEIVYQFYKQFNYPIFLSSQSLPENHPFLQSLKNLGFERLSAEEKEEWKKQEPVPKARLLEVSPLNATQLGLTGNGQESVWAEKGHYAYYCKGTALLHYSLPVRDWRLGLLPNSDQLTNKKYQLVMVRFLSWSLAALGVVGIWGKIFEKGAMVTGFKSESSEAVFIDSREKRIIGQESTPFIDQEIFHLYRMDNCLSESRRISPEEIYGLLMARTTFLHPMGIPLELRESMMKISKQSFGLRIPQKRSPSINKALS